MMSFSPATAAGLGALGALGTLASAFADAVPTRGDLDELVERNKGVRINGQPLARFIVALSDATGPRAKGMLKRLQRAIDAHATQSHRALRKHQTAKAKQHHQVAQDLRLVALFFATQHQVRASTQARSQGILAPTPAVLQVAHLRARKASGRHIPYAVVLESAPLAAQLDEQTADDVSDIGLAVAGYGAACGCGYGDADIDQDDADDVDEDAQLFLLLPQPLRADVEAASNVYPGAARALHTGYATRNAALAAQAFTFLRKERARHGEIAAKAPHGSQAQHNAGRALNAANALILHWSRRFYDRFREEQKGAPKQGTFQSGPNFPAHNAEQTRLAAEEAAQAAAAILKATPQAHAAAAAVLKDGRLVAARRAQMQDLQDELTQEIFSEATQMGQAQARKELAAAAANRSRLEYLLGRRRALIHHQLGLKPHEAQALARLEHHIVGLLAQRGGLLTLQASAANPPARAVIQTQLTNLDKQLEELHGRRRVLLNQAKSPGLAGVLAGVGLAGLALGALNS